MARTLCEPGPTLTVAKPRQMESLRCSTVPGRAAPSSSSWIVSIGASPRARASTMTEPGLTLLPGAGCGSSTQGERPVAVALGAGVGAVVGCSRGRTVGADVGSGRGGGRGRRCSRASRLGTTVGAGHGVGAGSSVSSSVGRLAERRDGRGRLPESAEQGPDGGPEQAPQQEDADDADHRGDDSPGRAIVRRPAVHQ